MREKDPSGNGSRALSCRDLPGLQAFCYEEQTRAVPAPPSEEPADGVEIRLLCRGIQPIEVEEQEYTMQGGDVLVLQRGASFSTLHRLRYRSACYTLRLDAPALERGGSLLGMDAALSAGALRAIEGLRDHCYRAPEELCALLSGAFEDLSSGLEESALRGKARLMCFLCSLPLSLLKHEPRRYSEAVRRAMDYINDSPASCGSLEEIAAFAGVSLAHFKAAFTREVGVTPLYYVNWRRVATAKRLLAQGYSITDVSMRLGFNTSAYFSTVFRNFTSRTPMQYRVMVEEELKKQRHIYNG